MRTIFHSPTEEPPRVGDYYADYSAPDQAALHAHDAELEALIRNSKAISEMRNMSPTEELEARMIVGNKLAKRRRRYVQLTDKQQRHIAMLREQQASKPC